MKPLQYWKNEVVEMKRFPSGVGSLLPIPVSVHRAETPTEIPSTESVHPPIIETPEQEEITTVDDSLCIETGKRSICIVKHTFFTRRENACCEQDRFHHQRSALQQNKKTAGFPGNVI